MPLSFRLRTPHRRLPRAHVHTAVLAVCAAAAPMLAGCAARPSTMDRLAAQPAAAFRGHYTLDTGASWFRPCGMAPADSAWWVTVIGTAATQADAARRDGRLPPGRRVYVEWQGVVTRDGEIGPRGPGAPALVVRAIDVLRAPGETDCR